MLGLPAVPKPTIVYRHHHGYEAALYGGLLAENITQGACRDMLAHALVMFKLKDTPVVLHVHDEIVLEVPDELVEMQLRAACEIMSQPPAWGSGFPLVVEGYSCKRYVKAPFKDSHRATALNGYILEETR